MFAREKRFHVRSRRVFEHVYNTPHFILKTAANGLSNSRFAFVVSGRLSKKATERNRLRRRYSVCLREVKEIRGGYDILLIARRRDFPGCSEIKKVLSGAGLLE